MSHKIKIEDDNMFKEIFIKANTENHILKNYFNISKEDYTLINSIYIAEEYYLISGFVLLNLFYLNKINLNIADDNVKYRSIKLDIDNLGENTQQTNFIDEIIEFFICDDANVKEKLKIKDILIIKELEFFFKKYSKYFTEIVKLYYLIFELFT